MTKKAFWKCIMIKSMGTKRKRMMEKKALGLQWEKQVEREQLIMRRKLKDFSFHVPAKVIQT